MAVDISDLPPPPKTGGVDISDLPTPKEKKKSEARPPEEPKKQPVRDRAAKTAEQFLGGTALGALTPEFLKGAGIAVTAGGSAMGFPEVAIPLGSRLIAMGGMAQGARGAAAIAGGIGGASGEVAAQLSEAAGQGKLAQETWRLAAGTVTPELGNIVGVFAKKALSLVAPGAGATAASVANAIKQDLEKYGVPEASLSSQQRKYIERIAREITGGATREAGVEMVSYLERGAEQYVAYFDDQARSLQNQADMIVQEAKITGEAGKIEAAARVDTLFKQFNETAARLRSAAETRAKTIEENGSILAVGKPSNEARRIIDDARIQAQRIRQTTADRITRLRDVAEKARITGASRLEKGRAAVTRIGRAMRPTEVGRAIRETVTPRFKTLQETRAKNAETYKAAAFNEAAAREQAGQKITDTKEHKNAVTLVNDLIKDAGRLTALSAPLKNIQSALTGRFVNDAGDVVETGVTFANLENLRRFLRDRSWGVPVEGFDAISTIQAGKLADAVEKIQREFAPQNFGAFLERYKADSEPLRAFQAALGKAVVGKEEFDVGRFVTDPAALGAKFFKTETGVNDLMELMGGDAAAVEDIARGYVADKLEGATAANVTQFIKNSRDWIGRFPQLETELRSAAERLAQAESVAGKRLSLSDVLRGKVPGVKTAAERELGVVFSTRDEALREAAGRLRTQAEARLAEAEPKVRKTAEEITKEAEQRAKAGVTAAEAEAKPLRTQAKEMTAEGQRIAKLIRGQSFDARRAREVILSGDRDLWAQVGPIIRSDENAMRSFADAVQFIIGERAAASPRNVVIDWAEKVRPAIETHGLMSPVQLARLDAQIEQINRTIEGPGQITAIQRLIRNALITEGARPVSTIVEPFDPIRTVTKGRR